MRVKCANCGMVYDKTASTKVCVRCGSNASDPVNDGERHQKRDEVTEVRLPSLLLDDAPAPHNPING